MSVKKISLVAACCISLAFARAQFSLSSPAFPMGGNIPAKYTAFNGDNVNPALNWSNKPAGTQSFLLVMFDRTFCFDKADTICRTHWIVKSIPATANGILEGTSSTGPLPSGAELGKCDNAVNGIREYIGPFPDSTTIHLYEFKLYALNTTTLSCVTPYYNYCLQSAIAGKVLGTASLFGYNLPRQFAPVPVNFVSVEASCRNGKINCKWTTATESADAFNFTVERSDDGNMYKAIASIPCTGNSNTLKEYNFTDTSNNRGSGYYRIKQTDRSGKFVYSFVAYVKCGSDKKGWLTVLPNPSPDRFVINFTNAANQTLQLTIHDVSGKLVYNYRSAEAAGSITVLANAAPGTYLLKATHGNGGETITERLIKIK